MDAATQKPLDYARSLRAREEDAATHALAWFDAHCETLGIREVVEADQSEYASIFLTPEDHRAFSRTFPHGAHGLGGALPAALLDWPAIKTRMREWLPQHVRNSTRGAVTLTTRTPSFFVNFYHRAVGFDNLVNLRNAKERVSQVRTYAVRMLQLAERMLGYTTPVGPDSPLHALLPAAERAVLELVFAKQPGRAAVIMSHADALPVELLAHIWKAAFETEQVVTLEETCRHVPRAVPRHLMAIAPQVAESAGEAASADPVHLRTREVGLLQAIAEAKAQARITERMERHSAVERGFQVLEAQAANDPVAHEAVAAVRLLGELAPRILFLRQLPGAFGVGSTGRTHEAPLVFDNVRKAAEDALLTVGRTASRGVKEPKGTIDWRPVINDVRTMAHRVARTEGEFHTTASVIIAEANSHCPDAPIPLPSANAPLTAVRLSALRASLTLLGLGRGWLPDDAADLLFGEGWDRFVAHRQSAMADKIPLGSAILTVECAEVGPASTFQRDPAHAKAYVVLLAEAGPMVHVATRQTGRPHPEKLISSATLAKIGRKEFGAKEIGGVVWSSLEDALIDFALSPESPRAEYLAEILPALESLTAHVRGELGQSMPQAMTSEPTKTRTR